MRCPPRVLSQSLPSHQHQPHYSPAWAGDQRSRKYQVTSSRLIPINLPGPAYRLLHKNKARLLLTSSPLSSSRPPPLPLPALQLPRLGFGSHSPKVETESHATAAAASRFFTPHLKQTNTPDQKKGRQTPYCTIPDPSSHHRRCSTRVQLRCDMGGGGGSGIRPVVESLVITTTTTTTAPAPPPSTSSPLPSLPFSAAAAPALTVAESLGLFHLQVFLVPVKGWRRDIGKYACT